MKIKSSHIVSILLSGSRFFLLGRSLSIWIVISLIAIISFGFIFFHYYPINALGMSTPNSLDSIPHELVVAEQVLQSVLSVTGTIEAGGTINVTAPFDGIIQKKDFDFDGLVDSGQILLALDSNEIQMRIQEARVSMLKTSQARNDLERWDNSPEVTRVSRAVLSAKLALAESQRKATESEMLLKRGIIPRSEYDALLEQISGQEIQLATANDDLKGTIDKANSINKQIVRIESDNASKKHAELIRDLENRTIKAPLSGVISQASSVNNGQSPALIELGSHVTRGQPLFSISPLAKLEVAAKVDEADVTQLVPNQAVEIYLDSQDAPPIHGRISRVSAQALPNTGGPRTALFELKVKIPLLTVAELKRIRVGMTCSLSIVKYRNPHAIVIPLSFVQKENSAPYTWVSGQSGNLQKRPVILGRTTESGVEVLNGLRVGDKVIFPGKPMNEPTI